MFKSSPLLSSNEKVNISSLASSLMKQLEQTKNENLDLKTELAIVKAEVDRLRSLMQSCRDTKYGAVSIQTVHQTRSSNYNDLNIKSENETPPASNVFSFEFKNVEEERINDEENNYGDKITPIHYCNSKTLSPNNLFQTTTPSFDIPLLKHRKRRNDSLGNNGSISSLDLTLDDDDDFSKSKDKLHKDRIKTLSTDDESSPSNQFSLSSRNIIHTNQRHDDYQDSASSMTFKQSLIDRGSWLVGLLILQSLSGFILEKNEHLLQKHLVIVNFLTMLVGAGGNAGNQASVRVIRGIALGTLRTKTLPFDFLQNEAKMALCLSTILSITGFLRAILFQTPACATIAITISLCSIVNISIGLGCLLPIYMKKVGIDPAHSSTTIQVIMDILGVAITCFVSTLILESKMIEQLFSSYSV